MARQRKRTPHVDERKKVIAVSAPAKANGAIREDIKALTEDITAYFTGRKQVSAAIADLDGRLDQIQKSLDDFKAESSRDYDDRLDQIQKSLDVLKKAENSEEVEDLIERLEGHGHHRRRGQRPEIGRAIGNLMTALKNRVTHEGWNEELLDEIVDVLDEAAQRIERARKARGEEE